MNTLNAKDKLKELSTAGFTEARMAMLTGIPQPTINRIINGQEPRETYVRVIDSFYAKNRKFLKQKAA